MTKTASSKVSSRGQITIPKRIRVRYHLEAGDKIEFLEEGGDDFRATIKKLNETLENLQLEMKELKNSTAIKNETIELLEAALFETRKGKQRAEKGKQRAEKKIVKLKRKLRDILRSHPSEG